MPEQDRQRWEAWRSACRQDEVARALRQLYGDLDRAVADYGPTCWSSGKCCKFESYGHRLYVTGLEIAFFRERATETGTGDQVASLGDQDSDGISLPVYRDAADPRSLASDSSALPDACRYQQDGKCTVHAIRPLGCRIFFCQEGTDDWQQQTYEAFQQQVLALHESHAIPYHYMEWRAGLVEAERCLAESMDD